MMAIKIAIVELVGLLLQRALINIEAWLRENRPTKNALLERMKMYLVHAQLKARKYSGWCDG